MRVRVGIGQDSHRFVAPDSTKPCLLGGLLFDEELGLKANSDGDVVLHAICNAISSVTGVIILGKIADELLQKSGITDSSLYLNEALATLGNQEISHVSISIEADRPKILPHIEKMRTHIAQLMGLEYSQVGITATSGEQLTACGCGEGIQVFAAVTTVEWPCCVNGRG